MRHVAWRDWARYQFDNTLSAGPIGLTAWLGGVVLAMIVLAATVIHGLDAGPPDRELGLAGLMWLSFIHALDPSAIGSDNGAPHFIGVMLLVSLGGLFVASALIGVLTSGLEVRLAELRKGRSPVVEAGHTVILGWSEHVFAIVRELVIARESEAKSCIVILGPADKVAMEDAIRARIGRTGATRIVCRSGSPMEMSDLALTNLDAAKSIIVLSPDAADDPDVDVIKTLLAITNRPGRSDHAYHIVAALQDFRNADVARIAGKGEVEILVPGEMIARMIAQTALQAGLSFVYSDLLDFAGDEIYFHPVPDGADWSYQDALLAFDDACVIGCMNRGQEPVLNPAPETRLTIGDEVVLIAADDSLVTPTAPGRLHINEDAVSMKAPRPAAPDKVLILGWNCRGAQIVEALEDFVPAGSTVHVVADDPSSSRAVAELATRLTRLVVTHVADDTTQRRTLERLLGEQYTQIIVLCYSDRYDTAAADARTLMTLLLLRDIAEQRGQAVTVVSEMLDIRDRALAEVTRADDFIVSPRIVSLLLAQVAENKHLNGVFRELFNPEGSELYLKPVGEYVMTGVEITYATLVVAAARRGESAVGYRRADRTSTGGTSRRHGHGEQGVRLNPRKSALVTFGPDDQVIVLSSR